MGDLNVATLKDNRGTIFSLGVNLTMLVAGVYWAGKIDATLQAFIERMAPVTEARVAIMETQIRVLQVEVDQVKKEQQRLAQEHNRVQ